MSFYATYLQVLDQTKDVTRRLGWKTAKPGQILMGVMKARGVKIHQRRCLAMIRIKDVRREPLNAITREDVEREGFAFSISCSPDQEAIDFFIRMFCRLNHCEPDRTVTRIEFEYLTPRVGSLVWVPLITQGHRLGPAEVRKIHPGCRLVQAKRIACRPASNRWYDVRQLAAWREAMETNRRTQILASKRGAPKQRKAQ